LPSLVLSFSSLGSPRCLPPFPTRRSSDLVRGPAPGLWASTSIRSCCARASTQCRRPVPVLEARRDRGRSRQLPPRLPCGRRELRSEEHTSELQSRFDLVCRLLLEKKNNTH